MPNKISNQLITEIKNYEFSFTASSLRLKEMALVASSIVNGIDIDIARDLGNGKVATGKRRFREFNNRLADLTKKETELLADGDFIVQKQIGFLAICKAYGFIRDFTIEVLADKMLVYDYEVTEGDYISFFRRKAELHSEMDELTETTQKKIKQVTFKILEEAGIIDSVKTRIIQPQLIDDIVIEVIVADDPIWLKIFLLSDVDIANMKN